MGSTQNCDLPKDQEMDAPENADNQFVTPPCRRRRWMNEMAEMGQLSPPLPSPLDPSRRPYFQREDYGALSPVIRTRTKQRHNESRESNKEILGPILTLMTRSDLQVSKSLLMQRHLAMFCESIAACKELLQCQKVSYVQLHDCLQESRRKLLAGSLPMQSKDWMIAFSKIQEVQSHLNAYMKKTNECQLQEYTTEELSMIQCCVDTLSKIRKDLRQIYILSPKSGDFGDGFDAPSEDPDRPSFEDNYIPLEPEELEQTMRDYLRVHSQRLPVLMSTPELTSANNCLHRTLLSQDGRQESLHHLTSLLRLASPFLSSLDDLRLVAIKSILSPYILLLEASKLPQKFPLEILREFRKDLSEMVAARKDEDDDEQDDTDEENENNDATGRHSIKQLPPYTTWNHLLQREKTHLSPPLISVVTNSKHRFIRRDSESGCHLLFGENGPESEESFPYFCLLLAVIGNAREVFEMSLEGLASCNWSTSTAVLTSACLRGVRFIQELLIDSGVFYSASPSLVSKWPVSECQAVEWTINEPALQVSDQPRDVLRLAKWLEEAFRIDGDERLSGLFYWLDFHLANLTIPECLLEDVLPEEVPPSLLNSYLTRDENRQEMWSTSFYARRTDTIMGLIQDMVSFDLSISRQDNTSIRTPIVSRRQPPTLEEYETLRMAINELAERLSVRLHCDLSVGRLTERLNYLERHERHERRRRDGGRRQERRMITEDYDKSEQRSPSGNKSRYSEAYDRHSHRREGGHQAGRQSSRRQDSRNRGGECDVDRRQRDRSNDRAGREGDKQTDRYEPSETRRQPKDDRQAEGHRDQSSDRRSRREKTRKYHNEGSIEKMALRRSMKDLRCDGERSSVRDEPSNYSTSPCPSRRTTDVTSPATIRRGSEDSIGLPVGISIGSALEHRKEPSESWMSGSSRQPKKPSPVKRSSRRLFRESARSRKSSSNPGTPDKASVVTEASSAAKNETPKRAAVNGPHEGLVKSVVQMVMSQLSRNGSKRSSAREGGNYDDLPPLWGRPPHFDANGNRVQSPSRASSVDSSSTHGGRNPSFSQTYPTGIIKKQSDVLATPKKSVSFSAGSLSEMDSPTNEMNSLQDSLPGDEERELMSQFRDGSITPRQHLVDNQKNVIADHQQNCRRDAVDDNRRSGVEENRRNIPEGHRRNVPEEHRRQEEHHWNLPDEYRRNLPQEHRRNLREEYRRNVAEEYEKNLPEEHRRNLRGEYRRPEEHRRSVPDNHPMVVLDDKKKDKHPLLTSKSSTEQKIEAKPQPESIAKKCTDSAGYHRRNPHGDTSHRWQTLFERKSTRAKNGEASESRSRRRFSSTGNDPTTLSSTFNQLRQSLSCAKPSRDGVVNTITPFPSAAATRAGRLKRARRQQQQAPASPSKVAASRAANPKADRHRKEKRSTSTSASTERAKERN